MYRSVTGRRDRTGTYGFGSFAVFLLAMYAGNIVGPPPPDEHMVAWFSLSLWAIPFWAGWFDNHRTLRGVRV